MPAITVIKQITQHSEDIILCIPLRSSHLATGRKSIARMAETVSGASKGLAKYKIAMDSTKKRRILIDLLSMLFIKYKIKPCHLISGTQ